MNNTNDILENIDAARRDSSLAYHRESITRALLIMANNSAVIVGLLFLGMVSMLSNYKMVGMLSAALILVVFIIRTV